MIHVDDHVRLPNGWTGTVLRIQSCMAVVLLDEDADWDAPLTETVSVADLSNLT